MKPIKFKEQNVVFAENQPEYLPLPALKNQDKNGNPIGMGEVISCWKLSFKERLILLFTGKLWSCLCMFGKPLTPSSFSVKKSDFIRLK